MDLSVFLILILVTFQFIAEYRSWNQYKVKLGIFIVTLVITLPNIIFMVIDWWQSPHSKVAMLVLNTFKPMLRGETYRLFRWLKSVGMGLSSDELNWLPISKGSTDVFEFYVTKECSVQMNINAAIPWQPSVNFQDLPEVVEDKGLGSDFFFYTKCTGVLAAYIDGVLVIHQFRFSRQLLHLYSKLDYQSLVRHPSFQSSLMRSLAFNKVDIPTAKRLLTRLEKIYSTEMPILTGWENKREWYCFQAGSTLDNLNGELVLLRSEGRNIAVR